MDAKVTKCASKLHDNTLLAKLSLASDMVPQRCIGSSTVPLPYKYRSVANIRDNILSSDMVALEAKYHLKCLATLYNRYRAQERKKLSQTDDKNEHIKSLVFAQLVAYID